MAKEKKKISLNFPFPFYGAGEAIYFETCEVNIRFVIQPNDQQIKKIIDLAPIPIKPGKNDFQGRILTAASDDFLDRVIEKVYGNSNKGFKSKERFYFADEKLVKKFNADIEKWLLEIHSFCEIQFAFRAEDLEAGGTYLSDWHKDSIHQTKELINTILSDEYTFAQKNKEKDLFKFLLRRIFDWSSIEIPPELVNHFFYTDFIASFLEEKKIDEALEMIKEHQHDDEVYTELFDYPSSNRTVNIKPITHTEFIYIVNSILKWKKDFLEDKASYILFSVMIAASIVNDKKLVDQGKKILLSMQERHIYIYGSPIDLGNYLYQFMIEKKYEQAIQCCELFLSLEPDTNTNNYLPIYCNALWVSQKDNTGLPIDEDRNLALLKRCLPFGHHNGDVYFNAACLYVEMNDFDKAFECIELAKKYYKNDGYEKMIRDIKKEKLFSNFIQDTRFKQLTNER